jgi:hypothetical protein
MDYFPLFFSFFPPARPGCDSFQIVKREKTLGPDEFRRCSGIIGRTDGCISLTPFSQTIGSIQQRQTMRISAAIFPSFLRMKKFDFLRCERKKQNEK